MTTRTVKKNLAGENDLLLGEGSVIQTRNDAPYTIEKIRTIRPVNSIAELNALDVDQFVKAALFESDTITLYAYSVGSGLWVEQGVINNTSAITHTQSSIDFNLATYLQDFNLLTRDHFTDDAAFDTYIATVTEYSKFDTLGFHSTGNASTGISTSARGLLVRQLVDDLSGAINVCPNGIVTALNAAKSNARVWDIYPQN